MTGGVKRAIGAALAATVAVALGCGDSPSSEDSAAHAAYAARVDRICERWAEGVTHSSQRFESTQTRAGAASAEEVAATRYERLASALDELADDVEALGAPPADAPTIDRWLEATRARADDQREIARALAAGDAEAQAAAQERVQRHGREADAAIDGFDADQCAPRAALDEG